MTWLIGGTLASSLLISWLLGFVVRRLAPRWGLVDKPGQRKIHSAPIPLGGGLAIWAGIVTPLVLGQLVLSLAFDDNAAARPWLIEVATRHAWAANLLAVVLPHVGGLRERGADLWMLLAAASALLALGSIDDLRPLGWRIRLAVQTLVAAFIVYGRGWRLTAFIDEPWLTGLLSVLWIVGLINSFNMLDNMDGLSAGVGAIAAAQLAIVLLISPDPLTHEPQLFVAGFLLLLVGSLLGFLWHNRPPARLFMGDAGSYLLGFLLAVMTLLATFAGGNLPRHAILAPLCVLAVPLYDTLTVIAIRLRAGRSPFEGDKNHFSHRLVELGLTKTQAVLTIYLATAACGLGALLLNQVNWAGANAILLAVGCLLGAMAILEGAARRKKKR